MKKIVIFCSIFLTTTFLHAQNEQQKVHVNIQHKVNPDAVNPNWQADVPKVIHPNKQLVDLYYKTWEIAAGRVRKGPAGMAASPYMDENCYDDQIWIWDGCFMTMFCKYAPNSYPGKQTLLNYYIPIHDNVKTPIRIHLRDNPPLFSWVEYDNYLFNKDEEHLQKIFKQKQYLQKHFTWFDTVAKGDYPKTVTVQGIYRGVVKDATGKRLGYTWTGGASGMDNTPRGRGCGGYGKIMWIDAICQQALSALYISRLAKITGNATEENEWLSKYNELKNIINEKYWDEEDGFYYDVEVATGKPCKIKTMASYWALMAEIATPERAKRMVNILKDEKYFGVKYPFPSLSRDDKDFNAATGDYWRGGIWPPMVYMGVKALEKYGYNSLADSMATNFVMQQLNAYHNPKLDIQTIWEVYNPNSDEPSTEHGKRARPEFCGWSALGPISLFIENMLGIKQVNALKNEMVWNIKKQNGTHGVSNFHFAKTTTNLLYNSITKTITVTTNLPYMLVVNGKKFKCKKGKNIFAFYVK